MELQSIEVRKLPLKTTYKYDEELDLTGIEVVSVYTDIEENEHRFVLDLSELTISGFTSDTSGYVQCTVEYQGKATYFGLIVDNEPLEQKKEGSKLLIKFTEPLTNDFNKILDETMKTPLGVLTASDFMAGYPSTNLIDKNTGTMWQTREAVPQWFQIKLLHASEIKGFRWYIGSSHRPSTFQLLGSNDASTWDVLVDATSQNVTGWQEFMLDSWTEKYTYYRWNITGKYSSYLYVYEIELLLPIKLERAFKIKSDLQISNNVIFKDHIYDIVGIRKTYSSLASIPLQIEFTAGIHEDTVNNKGLCLAEEEGVDED